MLFARSLPLILILALAACGGPEDKTPFWEVEPAPDGETSRVFGISLGASPYSELAAQTRARPRFALFEEEQGRSVEVFFKEVYFGRFTGRLYGQLAPSEATLAALKEAAGEGRAIDEGRRWDLEVRAGELDEATVTALTFIPHADFGDAVIRNRFGEPAEIRRSGRQRHYLYPERGIDVALDPDGKEVIQYVPPAQFHRIRQPLAR
jgi:hypothetical protein